jgi:hypothetical protein
MAPGAQTTRTGNVETKSVQDYIDELPVWSDGCIA